MTIKFTTEKQHRFPKCPCQDMHIVIHGTIDLNLNSLFQLVILKSDVRKSYLNFTVKNSNILGGSRPQN